MGLTLDGGDLALRRIPNSSYGLRYKVYRVGSQK